MEYEVTCHVTRAFTQYRLPTPAFLSSSSSLESDERTLPTGEREPDWPRARLPDLQHANVRAHRIATARTVIAVFRVRYSASVQ